MTTDTLPASPVPQKGERNLGIEFFRILAMILICTLHVLGRGGIYPNAASLSVNWKIAWYLETLGYCSVNCYALISGYANVYSKIRFRKLFLLWLEVFFITVSTTAICEFIPSVEVTPEEWKRALTPLLTKEYWYFNAYFMMFPFLPILNKGILSLSRRQHLALMGFLFVVTTVFPILADKDPFTLGSGYSAIWLMVLYVFGAYFRVWGFPKFAKWYFCLPVFFGAGAVAWGKYIHVRTMVLNGEIAKDSYLAEHADSLISYISPMMVIMALALMIACGQIRFRFKVTKVIVANLGKTTFGVFLVHVGAMGWYHFLGGRYKEIAGYDPWYKMLGATVAVILLFYLGCSLYSLARYWLFRLLHVNQLVDAVCDLPKKWIDRAREKRAAGRDTEKKA